MFWPFFDFCSPGPNVEPLPWAQSLAKPGLKNEKFKNNLKILKSELKYASDKVQGTTTSNWTNWIFL